MGNVPDFAIEFGTDARLIEDDDTWQVVSYDRPEPVGPQAPVQVVKAMS